MSAGELILLDPLYRITRCEFVPVYNQSARMGNSGQSAVADFGPDLFKVLVETADQNEDGARGWKAWKLRRGGRRFTFTAPDLWNANPRGHIATADGSLTLSVDIPNSQLTIGGVGAATAKVGDMVSYRTDTNGYWVGYVQTDATASSGSYTLDVLPRPLAKHATTPAVRRVQALGEFQLSTDPAGFEPYAGRTLTFEGMQVLR